MVKTLEFSESQRLRMFEMKTKDNLSFKSIADRFGCSPLGVKRIVDKIQTYGIARNLNRSGRKRCTTARTDTQINRLVKNDRKLRAWEVRDQLSQQNRCISLRTITNRLNEKRFSCGFATNKPLITPKNRVKRLAFARRYLPMPPSFWRKVLWTDESKFEIVSKRRLPVWKIRGEGLIPDTTNPTVKHSKSVMVWGCVSGSGVGHLVEVPTIMDAKLYVQILDNNLFQSAEDLAIRDDFIFQSDNDPKHTSKLAKKWVADNNVEVFEWPPQSPDLNIIEHLWNHLDRSIDKSDRKSFAIFRNALLEKWKNIPQELIDKLIASIPKRLEEVIKANGGPTSY